MSSWHRDKINDTWTRRAKKEGYRARSAFKLKQIQDKFGIIREGDTILDVGCYPGGWSQVSSQLVGESGLIIGVDLEPTQKVSGCMFLTGDITDSQIQDKIIEKLSGEEINTIVSDIAPDLTGSWDRDQALSIYLLASVLDFSLPHLCDGGNLVTKAFQGNGLNQIISGLNSRFSIVKRYSPEASRNSSSEVYLVCKNHVSWSPEDDSFVEMVEEFENNLIDDDVPDEKGVTGFKVIRRNS